MRAMRGLSAATNEEQGNELQEKSRGHCSHPVIAGIPTTVPKTSHVRLVTLRASRLQQHRSNKSWTVYSRIVQRNESLLGVAAHG